MSLPILPKGTGSGLTLPLLLGQAWPSPSRSGLATHLPFLLVGPLAFPFSPFWLGLAFPSFGSQPKGPTPNPKGQPQPWEGPTLTPRERRPTHTQGKEGPIRQEGPTPNWQRKGQPPLRKLPTPSQENEGPTPNLKRKANPYPRVGRVNPTLGRKANLHAEKELPKPPAWERKNQKRKKTTHQKQKTKNMKNIKFQRKQKHQARNSNTLKKLKKNERKRQETCKNQKLKKKKRN